MVAEFNPGLVPVLGVGLSVKREGKKSFTPEPPSYKRQCLILVAVLYVKYSCHREVLMDFALSVLMLCLHLSVSSAELQSLLQLSSINLVILHLSL